LSNTQLDQIWHEKSQRSQAVTGACP
jgi:hypothetical protein